MTTAASSRVWRLLLRGYLVVLPLSTKGLNIEHKVLFHLGRDFGDPPRWKRTLCSMLSPFVLNGSTTR